MEGDGLLVLGKINEAAQYYIIIDSRATPSTGPFGDVQFFLFGLRAPFALLWGQGAYGVYKCKNAKKKMGVLLNGAKA